MRLVFKNGLWVWVSGEKVCLRVLNITLGFVSLLILHTLIIIQNLEVLGNIGCFLRAFFCAEKNQYEISIASIHEKLGWLDQHKINEKNSKR